MVKINFKRIKKVEKFKEKEKSVEIIFKVNRNPVSTIHICGAEE